MKTQNAQIETIPNWNFDNSYARLPENFYSLTEPTPVSDPKIVLVNNDLAQEMGLELSDYSDEALAQLFSGNQLPDGAEPLAQAYAGHQFGHFTMLGDGRAHLMGEHITPDGKRLDIQLKGSGKTAFGRRGDGRAALGPMLREYIISEAMYALNIPTSRALAVVTTGEPVFRETILQGAILTRVASSHLRVGTFEYLAASRDVEELKSLADYAIHRHYPELKNANAPYEALIWAVMSRQITLITEWMRVGFIHGVMNTDNMTISGETIDYGPCAFMDHYHPGAVFSSIDHNGRYAFANQPNIAQWNLARFAEALLPLLHEDIEKASARAEEIINSFENLFSESWLNMMRSKLGLLGKEAGDKTLIDNLLEWMEQNEMDYTNFFRDLISEIPPTDEVYQGDAFQNWWQRWQKRLKQNGKPLKSSLSLMGRNNPVLIPRNHLVENALKAAEEEADLSYLNKLLVGFSQPYEEKPEFLAFRKPPKAEERVLETFCGT